MTADPPPAPKARRSDALRNQQALLDAAARVFVEHGVEAPVRDIAAAANVGTATIYRHFPTRAELIIAVYRHQIDALAQAGPELLRSGDRPVDALERWIDRFVDFLVTKHGLSTALSSDDPGYGPLHAEFIDRLVPVCGELIEAATAAGEVRTDLSALELMRGVGNLCIGAGQIGDGPTRRLVSVLLAGLRLRA